jgi:hydrogenase expression/formation protein HypC
MGQISVGANTCEPGQWLLVFQGAARELLSPERAAEIDATLDLVQAAMSGDALGAGADASFVLPSAMSAEQLRALTGSSSNRPLSSPTAEPNTP